ncbi:hypothetical protein [Bacillus cihuensis]|uniref:hypothetical protein n=1 Tax=Bacillus cihuensis TaxID=1208599 RepID=UPI00048C35A7|nr:hypothetical protein [Bacillus cihuensis]
MSKDALKIIVKKIRKQSEPIIATALINGATRVSNEMNYGGGQKLVGKRGICPSGFCKEQ